MPARARLGLVALPLGLLAVLLLLFLGDPSPAGIVGPAGTAPAPAASLAKDLLPPTAVPSPPRAESAARIPVAGEDTLFALDPLDRLEVGPLYELEVRVVDDFGLPRAGAEVFAAPFGLPLNRLGTTGDDGRLIARWSGRRPSMEIAWCVRQAGQTSSLLRSPLVAGGPNRLLVPLPASPPPDKRDFRGRSWRRTSSAVRSAGGAPDLLDRLPEAARREGGEIGFRDPLEWESTAREGEQRVEAREVAPFGPGVILIPELERPGWIVGVPVHATLSGRVLDAAGEPQGGVPIALGPDESRLPWRGETDEHGAFRFVGVPPGSWLMRAGGGPFGLAFHRVDVEAGERTEWTAVLDRGREARGWLSTPEGAALAGWRVELSDRDPIQPWCGVVQSGTDGSFVVPSCPAGVLRLEVFPPDQRLLPVAVRDGVRVGGRETKIALGPDVRTAGSAAALVAAAEGWEAHGAHLRLWQPESGRGVWFLPGSSPRRGLPSGSYLLEAGAPGCGWPELGPISVLPGEPPTDLGAIVLPAGAPAPATLALAFPPPPAGVPTSSLRLAGRLHRLDPAVEAEIARFGEGTSGEETSPFPEAAGREIGRTRTFRLLPGEYLLRVHRPPGDPLAYALDLAPGSSLALILRVEGDAVRVEVPGPPEPVAEER
ncbi:MAG: carboxypeptidase-like regulatory domain-containing protein [Planctomycetota bacterium]